MMRLAFPTESPLATTFTLNVRATVSVFVTVAAMMFVRMPVGTVYCVVAAVASCRGGTMDRNVAVMYHLGYWKRSG
jgi:hypothetical protein